MKAVFKVLFPQSESSTSTQLPESDGEDDNEDESCDSENSAPDWLDNGDSSINEIKASRISCYSHSLQLAILKGLSETKSNNPALARATHVYYTLHRSCSYKVSELLKYLNWVIFSSCRPKAGCLLCLFFALGWFNRKLAPMWLHIFGNCLNLQDKAFAGTSSYNCAVGLVNSILWTDDYGMDISVELVEYGKKLFSFIQIIFISIFALIFTLGKVWGRFWWTKRNPSHSWY